MAKKKEVSLAQTGAGFTMDPNVGVRSSKGQGASVGKPKGSKGKKVKAPAFRDPSVPFQNPKTGAYSGPGYVMATTGLPHHQAFQLYMAYKYAQSAGFQGGLDEYVTMHAKDFGARGGGQSNAGAMAAQMPQVFAQAIGPVLAQIMGAEGREMGSSGDVNKMLAGAGQFGNTARGALGNIGNDYKSLLGSQASLALAMPAMDALMNQLSQGVTAEKQGTLESQRALAAGLFPTNAFLNAATAPGSTTNGFGGSQLQLPGLPPAQGTTAPKTQ